MVGDFAIVDNVVERRWACVRPKNKEICCTEYFAGGENTTPGLDRTNTKENTQSRNRQYSLYQHFFPSIAYEHSSIPPAHLEDPSNQNLAMERDREGQSSHWINFELLWQFSRLQTWEIYQEKCRIQICHRLYSEFIR